VFERVILSVCGACLATDERQFGFKPGRGCTDAIFLFSNTTDYLTQRGSTVFVAALDISKAFDRVNHTTLFDSLSSAGMQLMYV
jgi:hypothetical protein